MSPVCRECGVMQASAEMRKSKKEDGGFVCKDDSRCKQRRMAARANEIANQKGEKR